MIEHLDRRGSGSILAEARRVLRPGGVVRLVVPDLKYHVGLYSASGDADTFMEGTLLGRASAGTLIDRVKLLVIGDRQHKWMYDGDP